MEKKGEEDLLKMLGARGAKQILEFLDQHGLVQYNQMKEFMNAYTLNIRLRQLLTFNLIQYHFKRIEKERGYKITEKGRKVLQHLRDVIELMKDASQS